MERKQSTQLCYLRPITQPRGVLGSRNTKCSYYLPHKTEVINGITFRQPLVGGVQPFGISGPHWKKKSCLGPHIKYTNTNENKKSHNVLSKFTVLCWAAFTAILGRGLDTLCRCLGHGNQLENKRVLMSQG